MTTEKNFSVPRKTLRWAKEEIDKFEEAEKSFLDENPGKEWKQLDFKTGEMVHGITFPKVPTDDIERGAYRAAGDLRNALDHASYAAAITFIKPPLKYTNFPSGSDSNDFMRRLESPKGSFREIPPEVHAILTSFEPWWRSADNSNGDNLLRGLIEMANPNKHQVPLGVKAQTGMRFYGARGFITGFGTKWDWEGKTELYRTVAGKPFEIDMELEPRIAFAKIGRLSGKPALPTFREMETLVEKIITDLETECGTILGK